MRQSRIQWALLVLLLTLTSGCVTATHAKAEATATQKPEAVAVLPTLTTAPVATATSVPTETVVPTRTPRPTRTPTRTPSPTPTPDPMEVAEHVVKQGETLGAIAAQYDLRVSELVSYNKLADPNKLQVGQVLRIPLGSQVLREMRMTATAVALLTPTPLATLPDSVSIPMAHSYQKANNCAPTTTSMILSVYGIKVTQLDMAAIQKPIPSDVNVTAEEVAASIRSQGLNAYIGYNGSIPLVHTLLAQGFPVMTEEWMQYDGGVGHFRAVRGYNIPEELILYNDSYYGPDRWRSEKEFLRDWAAYNNKYIIAYRPDQERLLRSIIGASWDEATKYETLRLDSTNRVNANPNDAYAWWGLGEALTRQGNYDGAITAFEASLNSGLLPWRYAWYRYGYLESLNATKQYTKLLEFTVPILGGMRHSEDVRYHRAVAYLGLGDTESALKELRLAVEDNPRFAPAQTLLQQLGG